MAKNDNLIHYLTDIANAIREKNGTSDPINAQDFANEIKNGGNSGGGGSVDTIEYWDVSRLDKEFAGRCDHVAYLMKVRDVDNVLIGPKGLQMAYNQLLAIAIDVKAILFCAQGMSFNAIQFLQLNYGYTADQIAAIPRLTEEEFYNLNVEK